MYRGSRLLPLCIKGNDVQLLRKLKSHLMGIYSQSSSRPPPEETVNEQALRKQINGEGKSSISQLNALTKVHLCLDTLPFNLEI